MTNECVDLRHGDRFILTEPVSGVFGPAEVVLLNISLGGMQIMHGNPLRIGTRARIQFRHGAANVALSAHVVWSRAVSEHGKLHYHSGIKLDSPDAPYTMAIATLVRSGAARQDLESLDRKRRRLAEREQQRAERSKLRPIT